MAAQKVLHMNAGDGKTSYATNSGFQKAGMSKSMHVVDETLTSMFNKHIHDFPKCFKLVDLGCSSGPNAFLPMSRIMDTIGELFRQKNIANDDLPEFEVYLNDLSDNDFNNLFKLLPEKNGRYFVYGLPGSFYDRLFPRNSVNFVYSSASIHWLSKPNEWYMEWYMIGYRGFESVPEGLKNQNKEDMYMATTSPPEVFELYANQYKRDFHKLLSSRAAEIIPGGRMVLIFLARSVEDPSTKDDFSIFTVLAKTIAEMAAEGLIKMDDLYSFNVPIYGPCIQEVESVIQSEGSFMLEKSDSYRLYGSDNAAPTDAQGNPLILDRFMGGKMVADSMRATSEPILASHFGISIMDDLFERYAKNFADHLSTADASTFQIIISLTRK